MFSFLKNPKFPVSLFITASLFNLLVLIMIFFGFKFFLNAAVQTNGNINTYYFDNEQFKQKDPLMTKVPNFEDALKGPIITEADPNLGNKNAPVTIVQFSDFQCEYCVKQEATIKKILENYKGKINLIWKDYPEDDKGSISWKASIAARCAQKQNKFWQYHDLLFSDIQKLNENKLLEFAKKISLDLNDFEECLKNPESSAPILDNITEANALDISGIPFVYINDRELMGQSGYDDIKKLVDAELQENDNVE